MTRLFWKTFWHEGSKCLKISIVFSLIIICSEICLKEVILNVDDTGIKIFIIKLYNLYLQKIGSNLNVQNRGMVKA